MYKDFVVLQVDGISIVGQLFLPVDHAHSLHEKSGNPKKLVVIDGAGHKLRREDRAIGVILDWLKSPWAGS